MKITAKSRPALNGFDHDAARVLYCETYEAERAAGNPHSTAKDAAKSAVSKMFPGSRWETDKSFIGSLPSVIRKIRRSFDEKAQPGGGIEGDDLQPRSPKAILEQWFSTHDELVFMPEFSALLAGCSASGFMNHLYTSQEYSMVNNGWDITYTKKDGVVTAVCHSRPAPPVDEKVAALLEIAHGAGFSPEQIEQIKNLL